MNEIYCSTGALIGRPNGRNYRLLEDFCPKLRYDGFEFMFYPDWYADPETVTAFLKTLEQTQSVRFPVMHCEKSLSEHITKGGEEEEREAFRLFRINCSVADKIGAEKMVLHLWNGVISDSNFENNLKNFGQLRKIANEFGLDLLVENVICHQDPMTHWKELKKEYPDIHFVFDTKMADFHRQLELLYDPEFDWLHCDNHIRHYHVNDYGGEYLEWTNLKVLPVGDGHIDFEKFFSFLREKNFQGNFTLEATGFDQTGKVDLDGLNRQADRVRQMISKQRC